MLLTPTACSPVATAVAAVCDPFATRATQNSRFVGCFFELNEHTLCSRPFHCLGDVRRHARYDETSERVYATGIVHACWSVRKSRDSREQKWPTSCTTRRENVELAIPILDTFTDTKNDTRTK